MSLEEDRALAQACARGRKADLERFEAKVLGPVRAALERRFGADRADEAMQRTMELLLVEGSQGDRRIAQYQGRGTLKAWVLVIASREALALVDSATANAPGAEEQALADDPELDRLAQRYRPHFEAAFRVALKGLGRRERVALRLSVIDGLANEKIAAVFHVHPSSVSRWLTAARSALREATLLELQARLGVGARSAQSIVDRLDGAWHASLNALLSRPGG